MRGINLDDNIIKLGLDDKIIIIFKDNNINTINDLWNLKRRDLKDMNFSSEQINNIIIKMQLKGIDLDRKKY